ncbi:MAG: hypothetical protein PWP05_737 [Thermovirga sp.]|jgi:hypothetical protein|nr:hypothetical protein [Thermovirga sp.]MDN5368022.1 hypothetical protein [Thermovirga sp.]
MEEGASPLEYNSIKKYKVAWGCCSRILKECPFSQTFIAFEFSPFLNAPTEKLRIYKTERPMCGEDSFLNLSRRLCLFS